MTVISRFPGFQFHPSFVDCAVLFICYSILVTIPKNCSVHIEFWIHYANYNILNVEYFAVVYLFVGIPTAQYAIMILLYNRLCCSLFYTLNSRLITRYI